jgi:regulator of protease activity HflC (stomatin/prohibitin superfamily)
MILAELIIAAVVALFVVITVLRSVRIVPQARARNVERFGRYRKTLEPGMNFIIPFIDRVKPLIDLREQVVSFRGQHVITEDNLVVLIDTVLFFQVTDPRAADYEIVDYIQAIEQITATMLRSVIGSMDLEQSLTSRDKINNMLRGVLDDASGKWGIRVTRVEIKAIDPPQSVKDAMEKQMRAEREKRAAILTAEGVRQAKILTAEGEKQSAILSAEGARQSAILRAEGQAQAIATVFQAVHDNDPDPKLLAYQYLQTLPQIAQGAGNTFWVIPSEVTTALRSFSSAFGGAAAEDGAAESRSADAKDRAQRKPATAETSAVSPRPAADETPAIGTGPAAGEIPAVSTGPTAGVTSAIGAGPAAEVTDAMSAMLAAAIPGVDFADPLGSAGSEGLVNSAGLAPFGDMAPTHPADEATGPAADSATASQGADTSSANGSEAAG